MSFSSSTVSHPFVDPGGDAWKNGLSPGNFHCLDPSFDSKGQNLTPKKAKIDPMGKSLCGRLCRSLWPWVGAGFRRLPFHLLFFHTPFTGYNRGFYNLAHTGPYSAFWGLGRVVFPPWGENRLTGPHRPEKPGAFPQEKTGAAHPRVSLRPSHRLGLAHRAKQAGPGSVLLGAKKPLSGFVGQRLWGL